MDPQKVDYDPFAGQASAPQAPRPQKVDYNPFAGGPQRVDYDPFAAAPRKAKAPAAAPSPDAGADFRALYPGARITSQKRGPGGAGFAGDWHHRSNAAIDVAPIPGQSFAGVEANLKRNGYPVIEAIDEQAHPNKYTTGPHWHFVLGQRAPQRVDYDPFTAASGAEKPAAPTRAAQPRKPAQRPLAAGLKGLSNAQAAEPSFGEALWEGVKGAPRAAWNDVKGIASAIRHPIDTVKGVGNIIAGGAVEGADYLKRHGLNVGEPNAQYKKDVNVKGQRDAFDAAVAPFTSWSGFKKALKEDLPGTALTVIPAAGGTAKLSVKGATAARLAGMSQAERAAFMARRAEEASHARRYGELQRMIVGQHSLDRDRAINALQQHQRVVGNAPVADQRAIINAVENASNGGVRRLPEQYRPAANALREVAQQYRSKIENVMKRDDGTGPSFIKDYYAHLWKQDGTAKAFFSGKTGSGKSLNRRKFLTYQEGLNAGLKPIHENPLDAMSAYVDSMSKYLQHRDLQKAMRQSGLAKWSFEKKIPEGHIALEGPGTTHDAKIIRKYDPEGELVKADQIPRRVLTAPRRAAIMYNRFVGPGVEGKLRRAGLTGTADAFKTAQRATNATSNLTLAFSGFHPTLVAGKAVASDIGNAITHTFRGEPVKALKSIAHAPIAPVRPVIDKLAGKMSMRGRLLSGDQAMTEVDKLWRDAGGRLKNDSGYRASLKPNLMSSFGRGTFKRDVLDMAKGIGGKGVPMRERLGNTADAVGRIMDTTSSAIFDHFVPAMKRQVFEREMAANLKPGMSSAQQRELARRVMDNISGRMGELERDNIFWSQAASDVARLVVLSPSWQYGDFKVLNDAAGKGRTAHGVAQAVGLVGSYYLMNGVANYLHTGQRPQGQDWVAYRTGGTTTDRSGTHPERATFPSVMKDVFGFSDDPVKEAVNKMAPLPKALADIATNSDYRNQPIYRPMALDEKDLPAGAPNNLRDPRGIAALGHLAGSFVPIGVGDNPNGANSGINRFNQIVFGERPAGMKFYDPKGYEDFQKYLATQRVRQETKSRQRDEQKKVKRP
ncbi:hypothetical protein [Sphingomonas sp.]|uniref:hypothetical protein n=1 Tax=Sphingomonas sp. TaxID=28214 RepID=UPI00257FF7F0|nr:hypothetical protein [Sphingomonas sp.]